MQEKITQKNLNLWKDKTSINMKDLFEWVKPWLEERVNRERGKGNTHKRGVTHKEFIEVVNHYLEQSFEYIITTGKGFEFGHKFGEVRPVTTECIVYNPKKYYFVTENGKKVKKIEKYRHIVFGEGTIPFIIWRSGNKKKKFTIRMSKQWKARLWKEFQNGADYMDYTMDKKSARKRAIIYKRTHAR